MNALKDEELSNFSIKELLICVSFVVRIVLEGRVVLVSIIINFKMIGAN